MPKALHILPCGGNIGSQTRASFLNALHVEPYHRMMAQKLMSLKELPVVEDICMYEYYIYICVYCVCIIACENIQGPLASKN